MYGFFRDRERPVFICPSEDLKSPGFKDDCSVYSYITAYYVRAATDIYYYYHHYYYYDYYDYYDYYYDYYYY